MQYKIPVQIENEDPILLGLSLRQLAIIMVGFGIAYQTFKGLEPNLGAEIALIPSILIATITFLIAVFRSYEMSFIPFVLSFLRLNINAKERKWDQGTDSFDCLKIGYIKLDEKKEEKIDFQNKIDKINSLEDKLSKI
ncbi:MAG: PrgI family protein [Candidatus Gracilibacteria bacterium]|nr:PrgI family protein [Candidatus Gracilibacteria bacterium]